MKFKAIVLTVLVLALAALVGLFYQNNQQLDAIRKAKEESDKQKIIEQKEREIQDLQTRLNNGVPQITAQHVQNSAPALPVAKTAREIELEAQLAEAQQAAQMSQIAIEEAKLLAQKTAGDRDGKTEIALKVDNARVVGKVMTFDKANNLLIFKPVGQPSLVNGQELGIRRRSSILFHLVVEELDQESGTYTASVKIDEFFDNSNGVDPITEGEDIIIVPDELRRNLPDFLNDEKKPVGGTTVTPRKEEYTPWAEN